MKCNSPGCRACGMFACFAIMLTGMIIMCVGGIALEAGDADLSIADDAQVTTVGDQTMVEVNVDETQVLTTVDKLANSTLDLQVGATVAIGVGALGVLGLCLRGHNNQDQDNNYILLFLMFVMLGAFFGGAYGGSAIAMVCGTAGMGTLMLYSGVQGFMAHNNGGNIYLPGGFLKGRAAARESARMEQDRKKLRDYDARKNATRERGSQSNATTTQREIETGRDPERQHLMNRLNINRYGRSPSRTNQTGAASNQDVAANYRSSRLYGSYVKDGPIYRPKTSLKRRRSSPPAPGRPID